jgi:cell division protein FtsX
MSRTDAFAAVLALCSVAVTLALVGGVLSVVGCMSLGASAFLGMVFMGLWLTALFVDLRWG